MKIKFQALDTSYRVPVSAKRKPAPQSKTTKANYDTVTINGPRTDQSQIQEASFARMLSRGAAAQLSEGASPERVRELGRQVAAGTYQPDPRQIAGRLLGLN